MVVMVVVVVVVHLLELLGGSEEGRVLLVSGGEEGSAVDVVIGLLRPALLLRLGLGCVEGKHRSFYFPFSRFIIPCPTRAHKQSSQWSALCNTTNKNS